MTETATGRSGAAPDWGINYGIRELWTEIVPNLWVGGTADDDTVDHAREGAARLYGGYRVTEPARIGPAEFDAVCTLYAWARPVDWGVLEYRFGFGDAGLVESERADVDAAADWVVSQVRAGRRTLVRCQAGLNRSSLIAALALVRLGAVEDGDEAIRLIRSRRSARCLFNEDFVLRVRAETP